MSRILDSDLSEVRTALGPVCHFLLEIEQGTNNSDSEGVSCFGPVKSLFPDQRVIWITDS